MNIQEAAQIVYGKKIQLKAKPHVPFFTSNSVPYLVEWYEGPLRCEALVDRTEITRQPVVKKIMVFVGQMIVSGELGVETLDYLRSRATEEYLKREKKGW